MADWISVNQYHMPKDREIIAIWKGIVGIAEYDEEDGWYFVYHPAQMNLSNCPLDNEACLKFTYWMELPDPIYADI